MPRGAVIWSRFPWLSFILGACSVQRPLPRPTKDSVTVPGPGDTATVGDTHTQTHTVLRGYCRAQWSPLSHVPCSRSRSP